MMKYRDDMTASEKAQLLAEIKAQNDAYAQSDAWHWLQNELRKEYDNMRFGCTTVDTEDDWQDHFRDLRRAALNHRELP